MTDVESLERQVEALSSEESADFRDWFHALDQDAWDAHIERDVAAGRLDNLAERARREYADGKTPPL
ncbi:MAG: hypothetical protein IT306_01900 [Chloroflexi bacterium]|nr:hypothetical protein [Chloroflexota bacterium]